MELGRRKWLEDIKIVKVRLFGFLYSVRNITKMGRSEVVTEGVTDAVRFLQCDAVS